MLLGMMLLLNACADNSAKSEKLASNLIDPDATRETINLYNNLKEMSTQFLMFGMHDAMGYGVGWNNDDRRSDVKNVCGDYPAVFSWDAMAILDGGTSTDRLKDKVRFVYNSGGINTICWHFRDPVKNSFYANNIDYDVVTSILPGGQYHDFYKESLIKIAVFANEARGTGGELVPIIFRPYHEQNGSWFWWGKGHRTEEQYIDLWQFTVNYLRDTLNVHNFIYAFSPDGNQWNNKEDYLIDYPGDDYVDMVGFDFYFPNGNAGTVAKFRERCRHVVEYAQERDKVAAVTEVGSRKNWELSELAIPNWFTTCLLAPIKNDDIAK